MKLIANFFHFLKTRIRSFHFFNLPKLIRNCLRCFIRFEITLIRIKKSLRIWRLRVWIIWYTSFWGLIKRWFFCLIWRGQRRWVIVRVNIFWPTKSWIWVTYIICIFVTSWTYQSVVVRHSLINRIRWITKIHRNWLHVIRLYSLMAISIFLFRFLRRWGLTLLLIIRLHHFWSFYFWWLTSLKSKVKITLFIIKPAFLMNFSNFIQVILRKSFVKIEFVLFNDFLPKYI